MEKFRIDNAYNQVFEYDDEENGYVFYGSFFSIGITDKMSESKQLKIIEDDYYSN